ncbi:transposase [Gudongella oleilytica]|uniref:transposase n=1 Tax=Gudongella oleilytica TaxID=1582259 RepID=UPI000FF8B09B|nr:transposase [Gudongella oleilytica]
MHYVEPELKERIIKLRIQEGRTYQSLSDEYGFPRTAMSRWVKKYRADAANSERKAKQIADMEEIRSLQREVEELQKENDFLKKAAAFFAKESK